MKSGGPDHELEFLLAFDGRIHHLEKGYYLEFRIRRVEPTAKRPHGLTYSFTLHAPDDTRLVGFDNAHSVPAKGSRFKQRGQAADHWHRAGTDPGRPYTFKDAATLIDDFFGEVERVLRDHGINPQVIATDVSRRAK